MNKLPEPLKIVVLELQKTTNGMDVFNVLKTASKQIEGFTANGTTDYSYKGYNIHSMLSMYANAYVAKLKLLNSHKIKSAPYVAEHVKIGNDESVLFIKYKDCQEGNLLPYKENQDKASDKAKKEFMRDMEKLAKKNYAHIYAVKSTNSWFINPNNGNIVLTDWDGLQNLSDGEKTEVLDKFKKLLSVKERL